MKPTRVLAFEAIGPVSTQPQAPAGTEYTQPGTQNYYLKDVLSAGKWTHPKKKWTLNATRDGMDALCEQFARMSQNGEAVPIQLDHNPSAANTLGYLRGLVRGGTPAAMMLQARRFPDGQGQPLDPDTMYAVCEPSDADCAKTMKRVKKVSVNIEPNVKDGKGNEYGTAITHVAVTPFPVVGGQRDFEALAASKTESDFDRNVVTTEDGSVELSKEPKTMAKEEKNPEFESVKEALTKHLGEDHADVKALTPENHVATLCKHFCAMSKAHAAANKAQEAKDAIAASRVSALETQVKALSKDDAPAIPPMVLNMAAKAGESRFDGLCKSGNITPKVRDGLKTLVIGAPGARNEFALSMANDTDDSFAEKLAKVLEDNTPVALGEHTKGQTMALSRETPGAVKSHDPEVTKAMAEMANKGR